MLVQLSPWETSRTSICVPKSSSRRRRKRSATSKESDKKENGEQAMENYPTFAASMITMTSRKVISQMKSHSSEFSDHIPVMAITDDHRITVLGKTTLPNNDDTPSYREFSSLQYNSRPGDAGSFFSKSKNGKHSTHDLPHVPAILDTKNERVYALQHGNSRLTCWDSWKGSGPDDKAAIKIELKNPALSLALLPTNTGLLYGSCQNGDIFLARVVGNSSEVVADASFSVEYLPGKINNKKGAINIGTFATIDAEQGKLSGNKRKSFGRDGTSSVLFYQVFCDGTEIKIVRNDVTLSFLNSDSLVNAGSLVHDIASINLLEKKVPEHLGLYRLTRVKLLVSSYGSAPKVSIAYTIEKTTPTKGRKQNCLDQYVGTFCAAISLESGYISRSAVRLSSQATQFGLITETVLAAASNEGVYLHDLATGSMLQSINLKSIICDIDKCWVLQTNIKHGILAIFYPKDDQLHVAFSSATLDDSKGCLGSKKIKASSMLASSLLAYQKDYSRASTDLDMTSSVGMRKHLTCSISLVRLDDLVSKGLKTLEETRRKIISRAEKFTSNESFRKTFYATIKRITKEIDNSNGASTEDMTTNRNSRDPSHETATFPNKSTETFIDDENNSSDKDLSPCLPQSFIDGSVQIVVSAILAENEDGNRQDSLSRFGRDARFILKILLQSNRISARVHFEGSHALQQTGNKHPLFRVLKAIDHPDTKNPLSASEAVLDLIRHCSDISERQLVVILDYMMCYANPVEIRKTFSLSGGVQIHQLHSFEEQSMSDNATLCKETTTLNNSTDASKANNENDPEHQNKIILDGVMLVLQMVVGYSECNDAMLQVALGEELSSSQGAMVLARLLPNLLIPEKHKNSLVEIKKQNLVKSACQWIASLSESFIDDLKSTMISPDETYQTFLLKSVANTTKNAEAVMSFKDCIGASEMIKKRKKLKVGSDATETQHAEDLMGYSIDRIIF